MSKSKGIGTLSVLLILALIFVPIGYIGLMYHSVDSVEISVSGIDLSEHLIEFFMNPQAFALETLLSRKLEVDLTILLEGHGFVSTRIKSLDANMYFEDVFVGRVFSTQSFTVPASGTNSAELTCQLDLTQISLSDITGVAGVIASHKWEVKTALDGRIEPVILFFPVKVPFYSTNYALTISDAPEVTNLSWESDTCKIGETIGFSASIKNVFRGSDVVGYVDILVREDITLASDKDANSYRFNVDLEPGESETYTGTFETYKDSSTEGFFLKAKWGSKTLKEQSNSYLPRLKVIEGRLEVQDTYWTVNGIETSSCELGEEVHANIKLRAYEAPVDASCNIKIRRDLIGLPDQEIKSETAYIKLNEGEASTYAISFMPDKPSEGNVRGYFVELEGDIDWTMDSDYPPRLKVEPEEEGTLYLLNAWWTSDNNQVTQVSEGDSVKAHIQIQAQNADISGTITIHIRKDLRISPDQNYKTKTYTLSLSEGEKEEITLSFTAAQATDSSFRGYFIQLDSNLWSSSWTMDSSYPPRLEVEEAITPTAGTPSIQDSWWTVNNQVVTKADKGEIVEAHVSIKAVGGTVEGTIKIRIRKDKALAPDEDHKTQTYSVSLSQNQETELILAFTASEKSGWTFRGYFIQVDLISWGTSWTMESSYPPRIEVD